MLTLTEAAAKKVLASLEKRGKGLGIKVGVKTTGCSGLAYVLEYIDIEPEDHLLFESNGVKIWTDVKSSVYVDGTTIDYVRNGLNEGFEFSNPNERDRCGCGESFRV